MNRKWSISCWPQRLFPCAFASWSLAASSLKRYSHSTDFLRPHPLTSFVSSFSMWNNSSLGRHLHLTEDPPGRHGAGVHLSNLWALLPCCYDTCKSFITTRIIEWSDSQTTECHRHNFQLNTLWQQLGFLFNICGLLRHKTCTSPFMSMKGIHTWLFALLIKHFPNALLNINMEKQGKYAYFSRYSSPSLLGYLRKYLAVYWPYLFKWLLVAHLQYLCKPHLWNFWIGEHFFLGLHLLAFFIYRVKWCSSSPKSHQPAYWSMWCAVTYVSPTTQGTFSSKNFK